MFVMNCKVLSDEILRYKEPKKKKFKRHRRQEAAKASAEEAGFVPAQDSTEESIYHPVKCEKCDTEVAVYDKDEVYHFFNVIAGPA